MENLSVGTRSVEITTNINVSTQAAVPSYLMVTASIQRPRETISKSFTVRRNQLRLGKSDFQHQGMGHASSHCPARPTHATRVRLMGSVT